MNALTHIGGFGRPDQPIRMNSVEISDLVESRHDNVKRTVERLAGDGIISLPPMEEVKIQRERRTETTTAYIFEGDQGERDSIVVVARLSPEFTARLVDQWRAMKEVLQSHMLALPQDYASALRALADSSDKVHLLEAANAELAPKADALDLIAHAEGSFCLTDAAKALQMRRVDLERDLNARDWIYRRAGTGRWHGHATRERQRLVTHKVTTGHKVDGSEWVSEQVRITPKGMAKLAEIYSGGRA